MPWFKVDDNLALHAKTTAAGNAAMGLWVRAGAWSSQQLTDGYVPEHIARLLGRPAEVRSLLSVGLWTAAEGGYQFHEWADRNPTRAEVESGRESAKERMHRVREARRSPEVRANTSRSSEEVRCGGTESVRLTPTRPDPTRPSPTTSTPSVRASPDDFNTFWSVYPRRVGKQAAKAAYAKALKKTTPEAILAGAERLRDDPTRDDAYTPHPQTWLNQGRWDDEGPAQPTPQVRINPADERAARNLALIQTFAAREHIQPELGAS